MVYSTAEKGPSPVTSALEFSDAPRTESTSPIQGMSSSAVVAVPLGIAFSKVHGCCVRKFKDITEHLYQSSHFTDVEELEAQMLQVTEEGMALSLFLLFLSAYDVHCS